VLIQSLYTSNLYNSPTSDSYESSHSWVPGGRHVTGGDTVDRRHRHTRPAHHIADNVDVSQRSDNERSPTV